MAGEEELTSTWKPRGLAPSKMSPNRFLHPPSALPPRSTVVNPPLVPYPAGGDAGEEMATKKYSGSSVGTPTRVPGIEDMYNVAVVGMLGPFHSMTEVSNTHSLDVSFCLT